MNRWLIDPRRFDDLRSALGLLFPAAAGLALYGFRAAGVWAFLLAGSAIGRFLLSRLRTGAVTPGRLTLGVRCLTLGLFCPATLFDPDQGFLQPDARWPALIALGLLLAVLSGLARRTAARRWHPLVVAALLLTLAVPSVTRTRRVLRPTDLVLGDVLDARVADRPSAAAGPWMDLTDAGGRVLDTPAPAERLQEYLRGTPPPGRATQTVTRLLSDDLPPLEDLVVGGHPAPIGRGSAVALLIGGLFLVYRGGTPLRVPALALLAAYVALAVLPLPVAIGPAGVHGGAGGHGGDPPAPGFTRRWVFERDARVGWAAGLTLVHYLLVASAIPLTSLMLATQPGVRPPARRGAAAFAVLYGTAAAAATVFVSVGGGAVLALAVVQLLWPRVSARASGRHGAKPRAG